VSVEKLYNIHIGEIALKGQNRRIFENKLISSIKKGTGCRKIKNPRGRILLYPEKVNDKKIEYALSRIFGISWYSQSFKTGNKPEEIIKVIRKNAVERKKIKLYTKRDFKGYPLTSMELNKKIGTELEESGFEVDLENPEHRIFIEILKDSAIVSLGKKRGLGGLPVGSSGKVLSLLSGGIDSPVASWLMMKRGCTVDFLHLHAFPTNEKAKKSKMMKLVKRLKEYSPVKMKIYLVPYGGFHEKSFSMKGKTELVVFRRFIFRIANKIAQKEKHLGLVTGDSIGQVASQTLHNIYVVSRITGYPVYRPLVGQDKQEIIDTAEKIGTYPVSIEKYRDCCSLVAEKHPATKAKLKYVEAEEEKIDIEKLVEETIDSMEIVEI